MKTIKVYEQALETLLELLLGRNDCLEIAEVLDERTNCHVEGCAEEGCPFFNTENLIKYLTGEWDEEHDYD